VAAHVAEQIIVAIKSALTGLTTSGARVYDSRVYELQDNELPGLTIDLGNESAEQANVQGDLERTLELVVAANVKQADGYRTTLNLMRSEVETALANAAALAALCQDVALTATEMEASGEGEKPVARAIMRFAVTYTTERGAPDTPV
jgi:hypothetical protein